MSVIYKIYKLPFQCFKSVATALLMSDVRGRATAGRGGVFLNFFYIFLKIRKFDQLLHYIHRPICLHLALTFSISLLLGVQIVNEFY